MVRELETPQMYADFVQSCNVALVHFWAEWNGSDYLMKPRLSELETQYRNLVKFGSVDVDLENMWEVCKSVGMINVPALAYYKGGNYIETIIGLKSNEEVEMKLKELLETKVDDVYK